MAKLKKAQLSNKSEKIQIDYFNSGFLILTTIFAIIGTYYHIKYEGYDSRVWYLAIALYFLTGFSITAGYHRLFSHRAYEANPLVKFFFLVFGAAAFQNSALKWCSDHRIHHKECDTDKDPYNIGRGFFYAHMGWIMQKRPEHSIPFANDLKKDKLVMWQHNHIFKIGGVIGIILPTLYGFYIGKPWGGFGVSAMLRIFIVHHATFFINSLCHTLGKVTYTDSNTAKDSPLMAFLTFGEGYHNFHHIFQSDYRNGVRWYHFDPTKWIIYSLSKLGLAKKLKKVDDEVIWQTKLEYEERKGIEKLIVVKENSLQMEFKQLANNLRKKLDEIKAVKASLKFNGENERLLELKQEFKNGVKHWNQMMKDLQNLANNKRPSIQF